MQSVGLGPRGGGQRRGSGGVTIAGPIHVHGVQDIDSLHRQLARAADRRARGIRDDALHDVGNTA
jgi:hypothetical protein